MGGYGFFNDGGFSRCAQAGQPHEYNSGRHHPPSEDELTEIAISGQKDGVGLMGKGKDNLVCEARIHLCDPEDLVAGCPEPFDDRTVETLIGEELQRLFSAIG